MAKSGKIEQVKLAAAQALLMPALGRALDEIAAMKGPATAGWFDEFEKQVVTGAKNAVPHGISMDDELHAVEYAIRIFKMVLDGHRSKLK